MNLGNILRNSATQYAEACAISFEGKEYSFRQVAVAAHSLACRLTNNGFQPGERVAVLVSNSPAFPVAYFGILWSEGVVVPINPLLSDDEVDRLLKDCDSKYLIVEEQLWERCEAWRKNVEVVSISSNPLSQAKPLMAETSEEILLPELSLGRENETAVILYTSGSTGEPKGVELTHKNLWLNAQSVSEEKFSTENEKNVLGPGEVSLAAVPLSHAFGQTNLQNGTWFQGGSMAFQRRFDPRQTIDLMCDHQVTFFAGVPTMYFELVRAGRVSMRLPQHLKYCVCGGAAVNEDIKSEFESLFGARIQESYGLTETSPMVSSQKLDRTQKCGWVGPPISGVDVRVVDNSGNELEPGNVGEIQIQGHNVFKGYFNKPEETAQVFDHGWFRTGDLGELDSGGEIRIVGRLKDVISRGGYLVYPGEVESVIHLVGSVDSAVVVGVPDQKYGEEVVAFVTLAESKFKNNETQQGTVIAEINSICKKKLAAYKVPRRIEVLNEMPKGSTGKIDKIQLRKKAALWDPNLKFTKT